MEKLQAPITPYVIDEGLEAKWWEEGNDEQGIMMSRSNNDDQMASFRYPNADPILPILDDKHSQLGIGSSITVNKEKMKKKRKRKNKEEEESQRMTHIAVERNRRRLMNVHLNTLRSLTPPSHSHRGDQASIIGGAIEFIKELEQLLQMQSLQADQKRMSQSKDQNGAISTASSSSNLQDNQLQFTCTHHQQGNGNGNQEDMSAEIADIEMVVIQNHVNLKIQCQRKPGQLLKAIFAFEQLRLTVLHLNVTSLHSLVHYSFNLKIEEDCKLGSAKEVANAVRQIFSFINVA